MKALLEKIKAWLKAVWKKVWPFLTAAGAGAVAVLLLIATGSKRAPGGKPKPADGGKPADSPQAQEAKEKARNETLNRPAGDIVDGLDDRARSGIDAAKQAGRDEIHDALARRGIGGNP